MRKFSVLLDKKLTENRRSSAWLASELGVADGTIRNYRKGISEPDISLALRIAKLLNFDLSECYEIRETRETYNSPEEGRHNIPRKEGVVEIPLFPKALDLLSGLHQSQNGLTIDLTMAKSRMPIAESLYQEGMFAVDTYYLVDCDDDYGIAAVIPWTGEVEDSKPILFTTEQAEKLFIRRVLVHEGGKFVFRESYKGSNSALEREIEVLGILKLKIEQL